MTSATPNSSTGTLWPVWLVLRLALVGLASFAVLVVASILLFVIGFTLFADAPYDGRSQVPFDRAAWTAARTDPNGERYLMVNDLLRRFPLIGMSKAEVAELLGPIVPDRTGQWDASYYLGPEDSPWAIDNRSLVLRFAKDRVVELHQVSH